ncbi:MAG: hypothetical protein II630_05895, partial [Bacteroidales bacterium]|nr:hypothetical protein [Bacteroidales bacterium]
VSLTAKGREMEQKAYDLIPAGMSEQLASCPLKLEDYQRLVHELDQSYNILFGRQQLWYNFFLYGCWILETALFYCGQ